MDMPTEEVRTLREDAAAHRSRKPLVIGGTSVVAVLVAVLTVYLESRDPAQAQEARSIAEHVVQVEDRVRENERELDRRKPVIDQVKVNTVKIDNAAAVGAHTATIVEMMYEQQNPGSRAPTRPVPLPVPVVEGP